jgi:hypothetical protein
MTTIKDLEQCYYVGLDEALVAIGWLGRGSEFQKGEVSPEFFYKLTELCKSPWQPFVSPGVHECDLCQFEAPAFSANLFVPYKARIYVTPVAIVHYIAAHWYKPPDVFIQAVIDCPEIHSMEYKKAILSNGGRSFVQSLQRHR